jgi:hypothetical protein
VPGRGITIDLIRLEAMSSSDAAMLSRYLQRIRQQRTNFSGTALTIRREDLNALAVLLESDADAVEARIGDMGFELTR